MIISQPKSVMDYAANRDQLLDKIVQSLQKDECFVASWLTGS